MHTILHLLRAGTMAWLLAAGFFLSGCLNPESPRGKPAPAVPLSIAADDLTKLGLRRYWSDQLKLPPNDRVQQVTLLGDQLVVLTAGNFCYSVEASTGNYRVLGQIAPESAGAFLPPYYDGLDYFFAGTNLLVGLNPATGNAEVRMKLEMPSHTRAISDKELVYIGSLNGQFFAYAIGTKVLHWPGKVGPAVVGLDFCKGNVVIAQSDVPPVGSGLRGHGLVTMIRPKVWDEVWSMPTEGTIRAPIVATGPPDEAVFVACEDGQLLRLNSQHGWSEWTARTPGNLVDSPLVLAKRIVQVVQDNGTWVIRRVNGDVLWKDPQTLRYLGQSKDETRLYFFNGHSILVKSPEIKKPDPNHPQLNPTVVSAPVQGSGIITVPDPDGTRLYLFSAAGEMLCLNDVFLPYLNVSPK